MNNRAETQKLTFKNRAVRALKMVISCGLASCMLALCAPASAADSFYSYFVDPVSITVFESQLSGLNGSTPGEVDFNASVTQLLTVADPVAAKKYAYYEDATAADGYIKIDIDFVSQSEYMEAIDVVFVLDQSGSMNMMSNNETITPTSTTTTSRYTSPCINSDHWYRVPVKCKIGGVWKAYWYYIQPQKIKDSNGNIAVDVWETRSFIDAIKYNFQTELRAAFPEYKNSTISDVYLNHLQLSSIGLTSSRDYMTQDFDSEHYEKTGDGPNLYSAVTDTSAAQNLAFTKIDNLQQDIRYYSPGTNSSGCNDRMGDSRTAVAALAEKVLSNYEGSRVGLVLFSGTVNKSLDLSEYSSGLPAEFFYTQGNNNTSYSRALEEAKGILERSPANDGRQRFVIFVTDGVTTDTDANSVEKIQNMASDIRGMANLYCVGISLSPSAFSVLQNLASKVDGNALAVNASTMNDFDDVLDSFYRDIDIDSPVITDIVGRAFELTCDSQHPLTISFKTSESSGMVTKSFGSVEEAAQQGVYYNSDTNTLTWDTELITAHSVRLSFYQRLVPEIVGNLTGNDYSYTTNESAQISYIDFNGETDTADIVTPAEMLLNKSVLTASLSCDLPDGSTVKTGDILEYTITLVNNGNLDLVDISVFDAIPAGTSFVSCGAEGTLRADQSGVDFAVSRLNAGGSYSVSFKVRVTKQTPGEIVDTALFGLQGAARSFDDNGDPICVCNTITHKLVNPYVPATGQAFSPVAIAVLAGAALCGLIVCAVLLKRAAGKRR